MLRATCQHVSAQCRAQGRSAEKNFESRLKMKLMPEYCVPYALHLLAFRHETASAAGTLAGEDKSYEEEADNKTKEKLSHSQEASQKMLKKRLKCLFDPLIESLGDGADNISFLMRMVDLIVKHPPINLIKFPRSIAMSSLEMSLEEDDEDANHDDVDEAEAAARMEIISQYAREVLLSHVKKDVNLTVYPGSIQFPGDLYSRRIRSSTSPVKYESDKESEELTNKKKMKSKKSISHYVKKDQDDEMSVDDDSEGVKSVEETELQDKSVDESVDEESDEKSTKRKKDIKSGTPNSGRTYEHSTSPSQTTSPLASDNEVLDTNFGDVSPISLANDSPAVVGKPARKGRRKKSLTAEPAQGKKSKSTNKKKRKPTEIDVFDEFLSPATDVGGSSAPKKPKSAPRASRTNFKKFKATPVSVPKSVMVNVTNSTLSSSSSGSSVAAPSQKKKGTKKKQRGGRRRGR